MKKTWIGIGIFIGLLIMVRLALPFIVRRYVNQILSENPDYHGHVSHVSMSLYRGAYQIRDINIVKTSGKVPVPFFKAEELDLSVEWKQVFHHAFVGEVVFVKPELNFVAGASAADSQNGSGQNWVDVVKRLFPIRINRLAIEKGSIHYRDFNGQPPVDVYFSDVNAIAKNLTNSEKVSKTLVADVSGTANAMDNADTFISARFDPYSARPEFDLNFEIHELPLPTLNGYLKHYAGIEAKKGTLSLYVEAATENNVLKGYAKPFLKDVDFVSAQRPTFARKFKAGMADLLANFFKNSKQKTTATRIPFSHTLDNPHVGIWSAIGSSFHHILIQALPARLDHTINLNSVTPAPNK